MKILCEFTAYYPSNEGVNGGYYDALGNLLNPDELTCAAPSCIPFYTKLRIMNLKKQWLKKISILFTNDQLTQSQYEELMGMLEA